MDPLVPHDFTGGNAAMPGEVLTVEYGTPENAQAVWVRVLAPFDAAVARADFEASRDGSPTDLITWMEGQGLVTRLTQEEVAVHLAGDRLGQKS